MPRLRYALLAVLGCLAGCRTAAQPADEPLPGQDLQLLLVVGEEQGARFEVHLRTSPEGGTSPEGVTTLRLRRAKPQEGWPPVFAATYEAQVVPSAARALGVALERAGFFALPSLVEERGGGVPLLLRVRHLGREHQVLARGRLLPGLERSLAALDERLPLVLGPWPPWASGRWTEARGRPGLVPDFDAAIACHRRWLERQPSRAALRLDLAVLLAAAGRREEAEAELTLLAADPYLGGFVPELRRLLAEPPAGR